MAYYYYHLCQWRQSKKIGLASLRCSSGEGGVGVIMVHYQSIINHNNTSHYVIFSSNLRFDPSQGETVFIRCCSIILEVDGSVSTNK